MHAVRESFVILSNLVLILSTKTLLQSISILSLLLDTCLNLLCLCLCVFICLNILLEVSSCSLNSLLLTSQCTLDISFFCLYKLSNIFPISILAHDRVYLYISYFLTICSWSSCRCFSLASCCIILHWLIVTCNKSECCHSKH